jgi:superfamily II DNA or RNA helicase
MRIKFIEVWPGVFRIGASYNPFLNTQIKSDYRYHFDFNGVYGKKAWYVPQERVSDLSAWAAEQGAEVEVKCLECDYVLEDPAPDLTPWQHEGLERLLVDNVLLAQWITGAGKSRLAIEAHKQIGGKTLIVCPAVVLRTWETEQFPKWAPDCEVWAMTVGRKIPDEQPEVVLCSYGSLHKFPKTWEVNFLCFDEIHAGIHGKSKRSQECVNLSVHHRGATRLGLTATPASAHLTDLWSQLNILCPHRFGTYKKWCERYFEKIPVGYEDYTRPGDVLPGALGALVESLNTVCHYVGMNDVGDCLPPVEWKSLELGDARNPGVMPPSNTKQWSAEARAAAPVKLQEFLGAFSGRESRGEPTAIVCYHKNLASKLSEALGEAGHECAYVSGDLAPKARHEALAGAELAVVTMRSVTEGLDLRRYTQVYLLEAYPVPSYVLQILGRFIRLFATKPVTVTICKLKGSSDEVIVNRLLERMQEHQKLLAAGKTEKGLQGALQVDYNSDKFLTELRDACAGMVDLQESEDWEDWETEIDEW